MSRAAPIAASEPFYRLGHHFAVDLASARAVFTTRRGGFSAGPYESLNLGRLTDDDPETVRRNRVVLEAELGVDLSFVRQVNGAGVVTVTSGDAGRPPGAGPEQLTRADGQVTRERGFGLAVLTADCLPVAVAGDGAVAMLHAGWRGLRAGVIAAGVQALRQLGCRGALSAAIGPGVGACCYEVGPEVHAAFADHPPEAHRGTKLDLAAIARHELGQAGVPRVSGIAICTICSPSGLLFSHRREHGVTGRQAGIAWLT